MLFYSWTYENREIKSIDDMPNGSFGFIYCINHLPTGKKYIGRKQLYSERTVSLGKRELAKLTDGRSSKKKKVIKESDWLNYWGSNKDFKEFVISNNKSDFVREIICFASSRKLLTYYETKYLFFYDVLECGGIYYNDNILGKFYKNDFITK
jgi:hypothetical protein